MTIQYKFRKAEPKIQYNDYRDLIQELVSQNKGQMSFEEYVLIYNCIASKGGCNLLVFGLGRDSNLWSVSNQNGKTIFLEDNPQWIEAAKQYSLDVRHIEYTNVGNDAKILLDDYKSGTNNLILDLPEDIRQIEWDVIIVDAPAGYGLDMPCRMKSIYESYNLSNSLTDIFVHDCERDIEDMYVNHFFVNHRLINQINDGIHGSLKHFRKQV